ncbi:putative peptide/nitrate transporter [Lachnellula subtilissima]|uniref:Putative peptide/nitrate transporter n=1 Tax=Lachnellula subtilissima TaxID=602034 RepID=A0A8H8RUX9_9HELO|nr:putative peptide/nitrate transporter [Lachnellula subtilissima]
MASRKGQLHPPGGMNRRKSSTLHYQTFPTPPPKSRGRPPASPSSSSVQDGFSNPSLGGDPEHDNQSSPLPKKQLAVLAVIALAEQTALNSISPYLPEMTSTFPEVDASKIGLYVGTIASSFALAQFATNFFWGWLSDRIGRKPVVMLGTLFTAACFVAFGFCRTLWQAVLVQALMGLGNGNQGVVSTCLGEITDRSNQSKAFVYLPVLYGIGGITGPAIDTSLQKGGEKSISLLVTKSLLGSNFADRLGCYSFFPRRSLEEAKDLPPLKQRMSHLFVWLWQFAAGARQPTYIRRHFHRDSRYRVDGTDGHDDSDGDTGSETQSLVSMPDLFPRNNGHLAKKEILNRNTILLLSTYLVFQLSNISFNSLFPIFAASDAPTGRELSPEEIGLSLSFAGIVTIVFQVGIFGKLKEKMGNKATYRAGLLLFFLSMMMMPWVGYRDSRAPFGWGKGEVWLWIELGFVLLVKTVAAVGGLTSALLLITNSAPNHSVLGTLNGLAQTLSAAGRAAGPFLSGGLFSLATNVRPKGEALAWGVFGGIAFLGWLASFGIRGGDLESGEWDEESGSQDDEDEDDEGEDEDAYDQDAGISR